MRSMVDLIATSDRPHTGEGGAVSGEVAPIAVIVPCYRCAATIGDALASIAAQQLPVAQVVLVDDASGDDTFARLQRLAADYPPGWVTVAALPANGGPSRARNAGWAIASQPYVAFLDADDTWAPEKISLQMRALRADPTIALIAHRMRVSERGVATPSPTPPYPRTRTRIIGRRRLLLHNPFPTASVILRRDLPFRFNENYRRVEDFLLWAQIAFSGYRCARVERVLAYWHKPNYGAGGLSEDLHAMHAAGRLARLELLRQGLVSLPEHWFARAFGMLRRCRQYLIFAFRRNRAGGALP